MKRIFLSSVQREFAEERRAIRDFIQRDPLMRRFFSIFLFEDLPATDRRADDVYLDEVDRCDLYIDLFGTEYGTDGAKGASPTEREFDRATKLKKYRLVLVKGVDALKGARDRELSREDLQAVAGIRDRKHFRRQYLEPLLSAGLLERTIPDKPRSSRQMYRLTIAGRAFLAKALRGGGQ